MIVGVAVDILGVLIAVTALAMKIVGAGDPAGQARATRGRMQSAVAAHRQKARGSDDIPDHHRFEPSHPVEDW